MAGFDPADGSPCVHCGFCLPACPTYELLGSELDSPRGRLMLMERLADGRIAPTAGVIEHLDLCLGCLACETACPSGVPYGQHLEVARARVRNEPARDPRRRRLERLVLATVSLPPALQRLGAQALVLAERSGLVGLAARLLPGRLGTAAGLLAARPPRPERVPAFTPAACERADGRRPRVALLTGCVGATLFGDVNAAAVRLLASAGCDVLVPAGQTCCGALHLHSGDHAGAAALLRRNLAAFEAAGPIDAVVVTAAGCGSALAHADRTLAHDPAWAERAAAFAGRVRDALVLLDELGLPSMPHALNASVACHDACHLAHAQRRPGLAARLLAQVPGLAIAPLAQADRCCGSAGIYNLLEPAPAAALGRAKLERVAQSGATLLTAANPGCLLHLAAGARRAGRPVRALHPLELLDAAAHGPGPFAAGVARSRAGAGLAHGHAGHATRPA